MWNIERKTLLTDDWICMEKYVETRYIKPDFATSKWYKIIKYLRKIQTNDKLKICPTGEYNFFFKNIEIGCTGW